MKINKLVTRNYLTASPFDSIQSIESKLVRNRFVVVVEKDEFRGVLTLSDTIKRPHNLVIDCLSDKPQIRSDSDLGEAMSAMEDNSLHVLPVFENGNFCGVVTYKDILDCLYEQSRMMERHAHKIERFDSLSLLAAGIGHDFRNMLTGALGQLDLLLHNRKRIENEKELLESSIKFLMLASDLAGELSAFSMHGTLPRGKHDLAGLIQETVLLFIRGRPVKADFDFPADLSDASIDPTGFSQVISNLVTNAVQSMSDGGTIAISGKNVHIEENEDPPLPEGNYIRIMFADTGTGIDPQNLPRIFDPCFTTKKSGSGLGLSLAFAIVRQHGGHLDVFETSSKGTTFVVWLPANK